MKCIMKYHMTVRDKTLRAQMEKSNQFNRLQNGTLSIVLTNLYLKLMKPVPAIKTSGVELKVLFDIKNTPLCLFYNELWKVIEEYFGFRSVYGYISFDESYQAILDEKADVLLAPVVLFPMNDTLFQYLGWPTQIWYELSVKQLPLIESSGFYIRVFPLAIWLLYFSILFGSPLLFWILMQYTRKSIPVSKQSYMDYFVSIIGSLTLQGLQKVPKLNSVKLFGLIIMMYGYLMHVSYSALLIARLSVSVPTPPFHSIEELKDLPSYQVCVNSRGAGDLYFREELIDINIVPEYKPEWKNRVNGPDCQHVDDLLVQNTLVEALCSKKIVSMTIIAPPMDFYTGRSSCTIFSLKQKYQKFFVSPITRRGLPYTSLIRSRVLRLMEGGLIRYLYRKQVRRKKSGNFQQNKQYINFSHVSGVFEAYLAATVGSVVLLFIEIIIFKYKPHSIS